MTTVQTSNSASERIALALSGGGFRATLFHLGVIAALKQCDLLDKIKLISAASGGSIAAAHMVKHWRAYLESTLDSSGSQSGTFFEAAKEVVEFAQSNVRNKIVFHMFPRWLLGVAVAPVHFALHRRVTHKWARNLRSTRLLQKYLDRLLPGSIEENLSSQAGAARKPTLLILASNITHSVASAFTLQGYVKDIYDLPIAHNSKLPGSSIPLAEAITASSAFPALFPPLELSKAHDWWNQATHGSQSHFLSDGGLADNLGVGCFLNHKLREDVDLLIVSDATGRSDLPSTPWNLRFGRLFFALFRIIDYVTRIDQFNQHRIATDVSRLIGGTRTSVISIDERQPRTDLIASDAQDRLRYIRTDFDKFTDDEVRGLFIHGYFVGLKQLFALGYSPTGQTYDLSKADHAEEIDNMLATIQRPFGSWGYPPALKSLDAANWPAVQAKAFMRNELRKLFTLETIVFGAWVAATAIVLLLVACFIGAYAWHFLEFLFPAARGWGPEGSSVSH